MFDYFAAPSDELAATTVTGGYDWRMELDEVGQIDDGRASDEPLFPTADLRVDPVVQLGRLMALLRDTSYDVIETLVDSHEVASVESGECSVMRLDATVVDTLATASDERLTELAVPWSETEEFWGSADVEALADGLIGLAALARHARQNGEELYCWICV
jgi:hypothetical protein